MNKKDFLGEMEKCLKVFVDVERTTLIDKYSLLIDQAVSSGKSEEEAISELGKPLDIAREELQNRGINPDVLINDTRGYFKQFLSAVDNVVETFSKKNSKEIGNTILNILVIFAFVALLKIPFLFLNDIIVMFLESMALTITNVVSTLISVGIELVYVLVAIIVFISMFKKRFLNVNVSKSETKE